MNDSTTKWAVVYANEEFICVRTQSGFRSVTSDPQGITSFLSHQADPESLGVAVREALSKSRTIAAKEIEILFDPDLIKERYEEWVNTALTRYGYLTRRKMFSSMKCCDISETTEIIRIEPSIHEKLEIWTGEGMSKKDEVRIEKSVTDRSLGEGVLLALTRCR